MFGPQIDSGWGHRNSPQKGNRLLVRGFVEEYVSVSFGSRNIGIVALGNGLGHIKAGIKAAADAVVIFPSFSGMSFSL